MAQGSSGMQRRNYFRIEYSRSDKPEVFINGDRYFVLDISEIGVKVEYPFPRPLKEGDLRVEFKFRYGETIRTTGQIQRYGKNYAAVQFHQSIPYRCIVREQVFLHRGTQKFTEEDFQGVGQ